MNNGTIMDIDYFAQAISHIRKNDEARCGFKVVETIHITMTGLS
jgi:hypothetical protein